MFTSQQQTTTERSSVGPMQQSHTARADIPLTDIPYHLAAMQPQLPAEQQAQTSSNIAHNTAYFAQPLVSMRSNHQSAECIHSAESHTARADIPWLIHTFNLLLLSSNHQLRRAGAYLRPA
jgi:hypothetical protein